MMAHSYKGGENNVPDERDALSESSGSTNGSVLRNPDLSLIQLVSCLPLNVRKMSWEYQNKLATLLNQPKDPICNDWHLVASRLGFLRADIEVFEKDKSPAMKMLGHCNNTTTENLFRIIQDIGRSDVIEDLLAYLIHQGTVPHGLPTQESLEDDSESSLSQPLEESSSDISKLQKQPSEQEDTQEETDVFRKFLNSRESENFWKRIPGSYKEKKWQDFWASTLKACKEESEHGGIDKFLCHIFKINYDERQDGIVRLDFFFRLLAFFGPYKSGEDGCLKKMYNLIKESVSKSRDDGKKHSWFAGYMNKEETEKRLAEQPAGKFLVRFSGSRVEEGGFVLAVQTSEGVKQIEIEKDTINNQLLLAGECFPDLVAIVRKLRRDVFVSECRQLLINPCPNLPLNDNFTGYVKATRHKGKGRGRPR